MKHFTFALMLTTFVSLPVTADDSYKFHLSLGTVADGLRAINPAYLSKLDDRKLQEPALVFQKLSGKHGWRATLQNCPKKPMPDCEAQINSRALGGAPRDSDPGSVEAQQFDLGFSANDDGTVRTRCLRSSCRLRFGKAGEAQSEAALHFGETKNLPLDVDIEAAFPSAP